jgi:hypothetical protein
MKALLQVVMLCDISPASPRAIPPFLILHFDFARSDPTHTTILRCQNQIMARLHSVETLSAPLVSHIGDHFSFPINNKLHPTNSGPIFY